MYWSLKQVIYQVNIFVVFSNPNALSLWQWFCMIKLKHILLHNTESGQCSPHMPVYKKWYTYLAFPTCHLNRITACVGYLILLLQEVQPYLWLTKLNLKQIYHSQNYSHLISFNPYIEIYIRFKMFVLHSIKISLYRSTGSKLCLNSVTNLPSRTFQIK